MSAVDDWKAQRGNGHNYATPALADAAIAELEAEAERLSEEREQEDHDIHQDALAWGHLRDRLEKAEAELAELKAHEEQTHSLLGKVLGTDTSLEHAAMRLLDRAEEAEAERDVAEAEVARLKESLAEQVSLNVVLQGIAKKRECCGNCGHYDQKSGDEIMNCYAFSDLDDCEQASPFDHCHFAPSRWEKRGEA